MFIPLVQPLESLFYASLTHYIKKPILVVSGVLYLGDIQLIWKLYFVALQGNGELINIHLVHLLQVINLNISRKTQEPQNDIVSLKIHTELKMLVDKKPDQQTHLGPLGANLEMEKRSREDILH